jgi:hypothetical protein
MYHMKKQSRPIKVTCPPFLVPPEMIGFPLSEGVWDEAETV